MADENGKRVGVLLGIGGYERLIGELEDIRSLRRGESGA